MPMFRIIFSPLGIFLLFGIGVMVLTVLVMGFEWMIGNW